MQRVKEWDLTWAVIVVATPALTALAAFGLEGLWRGWWT